MLPKHKFQKIRRIEIRTRRLAEEFFAGAYRSVFKGRGIDFENVRGYTVGDDVRYIDWNVTARMNSTFVKEFKEERELNVIIAVDVSASEEMGSGEQTKRDLAAEVAACLAFSAVDNGDKVGLVLFSDVLEKCLPPLKGRTQALRIIREILYLEPRHPRTSLKGALHFINHVQRRRAIVFFISDFLDTGYLRQLKVTSRRHDLIPIRITDPRERELPDAGWIVLKDAETGECAEINTTDPAVRAAFAASADTRLEELRRALRRAGADLIELSTDSEYLSPMHRFMERRLHQRCPA